MFWATLLRCKQAQTKIFQKFRLYDILRNDARQGTFVVSRHILVSSILQAHSRLEEYKGFVVNKWFGNVV